MTEAEELELLELENENAMASSPSADIPQAENQGGGALEFVNRQLQRVPAAIRGGVQAYQTGDPHQAANMAYQGFKDPGSVQTSSEMMGRFGADTAMTKPQIKTPPPDAETQWASLGNVPDETKEKLLGFKLTPDTTYTSQANELGNLYDVVAPTGLEIIPAAKIAQAMTKGGKAVASEAKRAVMNSPGMRKAAEKAILDNYAPRFRAGFAPSNPTPGVVKNASSDLAETLKQNDLLRAPEAAKINLNSGKERIGKAIDNTIQKATSEDVSVNVQDVINSFANDTRSLLKRTGKGAGEIKGLEEKIIPQIQSIVDNLGPDELGNIPLDKGVEFRRGLQAMVKNWDGENQNIAQVVAKRLSSDMNKKIAASHKIHGPRLAKLNEKYSSLMDAEDMITEGYEKAYAKASGVNLNDRGVPLTKQGAIDRILQGAMNPRETLMKKMPGLAEKVANDAYLPAGSKSALPEYVPPAPTVSADELAALGLDVGPKPKTLPPRTPQGRPALDKAPTYIPGQAKEGLPPRVPQGTRRSFEDKAPTYIEGRTPDPDALPPRQQKNARRSFEEKPVTYVREKAEGLPPREPKNPRRPLGSTPSDPEAFLQVLADAKGWPPGLNEDRIKRLVQAYKKSKPDAQKAKIMNMLREEWAKAMESAR